MDEIRRTLQNTESELERISKRLHALLDELQDGMPVQSKQSVTARPAGRLTPPQVRMLQIAAQGEIRWHALDGAQRVTARKLLEAGLLDRTNVRNRVILSASRLGRMTLERYEGKGK